MSCGWHFRMSPRIWGYILDSGLESGTVPRVIEEFKFFELQGAPLDFGNIFMAMRHALSREDIPEGVWGFQYLIWGMWWSHLGLRDI